MTGPIGVPVAVGMSLGVKGPMGVASAVPELEDETHSTWAPGTGIGSPSAFVVDRAGQAFPVAELPELTPERWRAASVGVGCTFGSCGYVCVWVLGA